MITPPATTAPAITPAQVQAALHALRIDTPYYTARMDPGANCVVIQLYGGGVARWPLPLATSAPAARRRKAARREPAA